MPNLKKPGDNAGSRTAETPVLPDRVVADDVCPQCEGTGKHHGRTCHQCDGTGSHTGDLEGGEA